MSNAILSGITDNNPNVRQAAAVMAGLSEDPMLAVKVAKLLRDRFWQVPRKSGLGLGETGQQIRCPGTYEKSWAPRMRSSEKEFWIPWGTSAMRKRRKRKRKRTLW